MRHPRAHSVETTDYIPPPTGRWLTEAVRARAYEIFLHRTRAAGEGQQWGGNAESDWLQAEREIRDRFGIRQEAAGPR